MSTSSLESARSSERPPAWTEPLGRPIRGPSALAEDPRRFWHLTFTIAKNEWRLRFFGSALGYAWQLMRPLLLFGVLFIVFTQILNVGKEVPHFAAILLADVVLMTFFAEATVGAVRSVVDREQLVRKIQFPRLVIPLSVVLTAVFNLAMNLVVVLVFTLALGVHPRATWLYTPGLLLMLALLAAGMAMILSVLFVRFRDIQPIWDVVIQVLFYVTPVIYPLEKLTKDHPGPIVGIPHETFMHIYMSNPLAMLLTQFRHAVSGGPSAAAAIGGWRWMPIPLLITGSIVAFGYWYFNRMAPHIAEDL
jgi:ABC-2 type transport system permease protein